MEKQQELMSKPNGKKMLYAKDWIIYIRTKADQICHEYASKRRALPMHDWCSFEPLWIYNKLSNDMAITLVA